MPGQQQQQITKAERSPIPAATSGMTLEDALEVSGVDRAEFALLATTTFKQSRSLEELATLIATTRRRGLDGMLRHVYFEKFGGDGGAPSLHVAIDGLRAIAANTGRYAGSQEARFSGHWDMPTGDGKNMQVPEKATVVVWALVGGRSCAFEGTAFMQEFWRANDQWRRRPRHMLAIRAEGHALRKAFPVEMSGIAEVDMVEDEAPSHRQVNEAEKAAYMRAFPPDELPRSKSESEEARPIPERDPELQDALIDNETLLIDARDVGVGQGVLKRYKADPEKWSLLEINEANNELRSSIRSHQEL